MEEADIQECVKLLEEAGYEGARELIEQDLIPLAREKHISFDEAAHEYADSDEECDTSYYQLWEALTRISSEAWQSLNIHKPL